MSLQSFFAKIIAQPRSWLRAASQRDRLESEMDAELATHLEYLTADLVRAGIAPAEAARRARIALGTATTHKEGMRDSLGLRWWDELRADLRYGWRILAKSPGFTAIAAGSLALAIGANTAIFSLAKGMLYDRLNVPHPRELRMLDIVTGKNSVVDEMWGSFEPDPNGGGMRASIFSYPVYKQLRAQNHVMGDMLAYQENSMNATLAGTAQRVDAALVSGNYFSVLGVQAKLGRTIGESDDAAPGSGAVVVISDRVWRDAFGRSPSAIGATITVNQAEMTVIGVMPRGFTGAKSTQGATDIYIPLSMQPVVDPKGKQGSLLNDHDLWWLNVVGRAKPGVTDQQMQAALQVEFAAAVRATMTVKEGKTIPRLVVADGARGINFVGNMYSKPITVLMTMTGFVLLLACANIANLLLARGARRQREMSVRLALGAGRGRVLRQLLTESLMLAAMGGAGGLLLGFLSRNAIPRLMSSAWETTAPEAPMDWGVFAFAAGITILTGLIFGLAPAWLAARSEVSSSLKESAQTTTRCRKGLSGKAIVAFQIALSTLLVVGAGLFLRTLLALDKIDPGFRTDHLVLFELSPPVHRYGPGKDVALHQRLEQAFAALPGVTQVTPAQTIYLANNMSNSGFQPEGEKQQDGDAEDFNTVGNTYFQTMGIPILGGRGFTAQDTVSSPKVAVINQALAKKRFPGVNPIGKRFRTDGDGSDWIQVVGICGDVRYANLRDEAPPQFFVPYVQQKEVGGLSYILRTGQPVAELAPALRRVVQGMDRDLPLVDLRTQEEQIADNMQMERTFAALTTGFGVLALALACVGIYGIMAYTVANRRNEIGIRMALGAQPGQVRGMVLRESTWLAVAGIAAGVGGALALTRLVKSMLYGIEPYDPLTIGCGVFILLVVALGASWVPARRAAAVQPMEALRHE